MSVIPTGHGPWCQCLNCVAVHQYQQQALQQPPWGMSALTASTEADSKTINLSMEKIQTGWLVRARGKTWACDDSLDELKKLVVAIMVELELDKSINR